MQSPQSRAARGNVLPPEATDSVEIDGIGNRDRVESQLPAGILELLVDGVLLPERLLLGQQAAGAPPLSARVRFLCMRREFGPGRMQPATGRLA